MAGNSAPHSTLPYIGSKISLISNAEIRYEGILYTINTTESTVALQNVKSFGTEGRKVPDIPGSDEVYDFIIFRGKDIKDLTVCAEPSKLVPDDPAIVNVNIAPPQSHWDAQHGGGMGDHHRGNIGDGMHHRGGGGMDRGMGVRHTPHGHGPSRAPQRDYGYGDYQDGGYRGGSRYNPTVYGGYGGGDGGYVPRGGGGRHNAGGGQRFVVGELVAQPNQATKSQVSGEFDFVAANSHFEKSAMKLEEVEKEGGVTVRSGYDKASFFDSISCEALDRQAGHDIKIDRDRQRQLDTETFGQAANQRGSRYRRGYRRGGSYRRGRGGYGGYGGYSSYGGGGAYGGGGYGGGGGGANLGGSGRPAFGRGF